MFFTLGIFRKSPLHFYLLPVQIMKCFVQHSIDPILRLKGNKSKHSIGHKILPPSPGLSTSPQEGDLTWTIHYLAVVKLVMTM
ncbi:unnamed protein product [Linum trigynum]|uniref:Uncharacterized protein n=1 Tax=Linum trigynum TaxID=586398 RepID=A0AAV2F273_9ROSI